MGKDLFVKTGEKGTPEMEMCVYEFKESPCLVWIKGDKSGHKERSEIPSKVVVAEAVLAADIINKKVERRLGKNMDFLIQINCL